MLLRKSREDIEAEKHGRFETLVWHEKALHALAKSYGISIDESDIYRELKSGDSLAEREETQRLLKQVIAGAYAGVLMNDMQRVSRGDMIDQGIVVSVFKSTDTLIITPTKIYNLREDDDTQYMEIDLMYGRMELKRIKKRLLDGRDRRAEDGQYIGGVKPYGWNKVIIDRKKTLEPSEDHDTLYEWYAGVADGTMTPRSIAADLNRRGVRSPYGGYWSPKTVRGIIRNKINIGYVTWNKRKTVEVIDEDMKRTKKRIASPDAIEIVGLHRGKGRITDELFEAANRQIDNRSASRERSTRPLRNPLASLLVCKHCHKAMIRKTYPRSSGQITWILHSDYNKFDCTAMGSKMRDVMDLFVGSLESAAADIEVSLSGNTVDKTASIEARIDSIKKGLLQERNAVGNLFRLVEKGLITDEEFASRKAGSDERTAYLTEQLDGAKAKMKGKPSEEALLANVREAIALMRDYEGKEKEINDFLKSFISRIEYEKDPETKKLHLEIFFR